MMKRQSQRYPPGMQFDLQINRELDRLSEIAKMKSAGEGSDSTNLIPVSMSCFRDYGIYVLTQTDDGFSYVMSYAGEETLIIGTDYGYGNSSSELNAISRFQAMEGLNPQVKRKILSDNPRRFYRI